jgi:hypothetical protein
MSATAAALLEQLKQLSRAEQDEVYQQLLRWLKSAPQRSERPFPTVKVSGGVITSQHVAEALDDE